MIIDLIGSVFIVFFASILFVNAVEFIGFRLNVSKSFIGTIVSPLFTSFPELVIFLIAIFQIGSFSGYQEAIGTIFGETFMSSSLSYSLVFLSILFSFFVVKKYRKVIVPDKALFIPYIFISILFPFSVLPFFFPSLSIFIGAIFIISYFIYFYIIFKRKDAEMFESAEKPFLSRYMGNFLGTTIQIIISAILIYIGSRLLLLSLLDYSSAIKISVLALSIVFIPVATAIPETITAMIWAFRGKDTLSIASLVGEKILYSTIYPGIALLIIPWNLDIYVFLSVISTTIVSIIYATLIWKGKFKTYFLLIGFIFFVFYVLII